MREGIELHFAGDATRVQGCRELRELLVAEPSLRNYQFAHRLFETYGTGDAAQTRVALLTSYTVDFLVPLLKVELMLSDIAAAVYKPHFNQFRQEILNPSSGLYSFNPDVVIVAFHLEDVFPDAVSRFPALSADERQNLKSQILDLCGSLSSSFRQNAKPHARLLIQDFVAPFDAYDPLVRNEGSIHAFIEEINEALKKTDSSVLDYSRLVQQCGAQTWTDPRTYYTARIPVVQTHWVDLARYYARYVRAGLNSEVKCIVLDLDNTLWGGVLGEDGFDGIRIGGTYPGIVFKRFQEYLLALYANGYILAISSKNDHADVIDVFRRHPEMVLREHHFAAIEANWKSKAEGLHEISKQIQISTDHMLFVDDNLVEVAKVQASIPGVRCLHISSPPLDFKRQFDAMRCLGRLLVTEEDRQRGQQYFEDRQRREFRQTTGSIDDFYRSLKQRLIVHTNNPQHAARIAQLSQRTNQFNMTTIRLQETEVVQMMQSTEQMLVTADLSDDFGDSGTIAYVQIRKCSRSWVIENWLMSCRVLGRTVEDRLFDHIAERATQAGMEVLVGNYAATKKNAPFADFYRRNGFEELEAGKFALRLKEWHPRQAFVEIVQESGQAA